MTSARPQQKVVTIQVQFTPAGILSAGTAILTTTKALSPKSQPPPIFLPQRPGHFTGRAKALAWIKEHLSPTKHLTIIGTGGLGKTAVVNEALHQLKDAGELQKQFPNGVIFHTFYQKPRLVDAYATILEAVEQKMV